MAPLILNLSTGCELSTTCYDRLTPGKRTPERVQYEGGWAPELVWMVLEKILEECSNWKPPQWIKS